MIGYLKGKVKYLSLDYVLLEVNGIGYEVICSGAAFSKLSGASEGEVYTYLKVSDDGITLYGFADVKEKQLFLKLTSVQGVGAKMAIALLSSMRPEDISTAIATADAKRLSAVKGLGKKTAERIILELHGKISADELLNIDNMPTHVVAPPNEADDDAVSALMGLGFTKQESVRAIEKAKNAGAKTVEDMIAVALREI